MYTRDDYARRLLSLWASCSRTYRNISREYDELLAQKRVLGIKLCKIPTSVLREYPYIPFLEQSNEKEAVEFLKELSIDKMKEIDGEIDMLINYNYTYRTLRDWVYQARYQIEHKGERSVFGINPDKPTIY